MEIGDPPLMNSWAPEAMELFADEFQELEELARAEQATFTHTLETSRVQATSEVETFLQRTTTTQVSHRKAPKSTRSHDDRGGHQAAAEKERLIRQKMDEVRRRHDAQMWRQLVKGYDSDLKEVQRSVDPVKTRELKEYDFFCGQNLEFFSMDDILCEDRFRAPNSHAGTASMANTFTDTTATAKPTELVAPARRGSATKRRRTSPPAGRQLSSARPSSSPMSRELREEFSGTTTMNTTMPTSPPFIIDAVGFARDYNRALEEEYGYKTVLGAPRMPEAVTAEDELRARLESHRPGLDTEPPVFCSSPNTNPAAVGEPSATQKGTARSSVLHFPMVEAALPSDGAMNSTMEGTRGCLKNGPRGHSAFTLPRLSVGGTTEAADSSTSPAALTAAAEPSTKLVQPPAPTGSNTLGVECSAKNQRVELRTLTGVEQTVVVRFTNRNAERTRLRVHPSTHSWIRVRCTKICPVAGKADKSMNYANPVSCGGYIEVEVVFKPMDTSEPRFDAHLQIGVTRELNARSAVGAQWQFVDVVLHCETVLPEFHFCCSDGDDASTGLRSVSGTLTSTDLRALKNKHYTRECQFPPTFIMAEAGLHYYLENIGSASVVSVQCESPSFLLTPAPDTVTELANGDALELQLTFSPTVEGPCEANMVVTVREQRDGPVVSEHFFRMRGEGILPHVNILSVDTMAIECSGRPQWVLTPEEGVPRYVALNATPDVPITVPVIVENTSAVSLPFYWRYESAADEDGGEQCIRDPSDMRIVPASGTLPPFTTITCTLFMVPKSTAPVVTSWNLFIDGLPNPVSANAAVLPYIEDSIVRFFSRDKWIPSAAAGALQRKAYTLTDPNTSADAYADPFAAFQQCLARQMDLGIDGTFATGFFVFAQPVAPSALFIPQCLDEAVECLVNYENVRHITVRNDSPRPLHFIFDPTEAESNGHADPRKKQTEASPVAVSFRPRTGVIAPFASSVVTVRFTVRTAGKHRASVDCYIQEIMSRRPAGAPCSHALDIHVTGVGASVHTSTELLDFGLIELGHEGEASFTVTNDNPIPVVFDMQDPLMREPPRFAFIPPFFRLSAGDSVEVTVYRKAVSLDDAQTFFELVIRDGCTIAIETRATIQSPMMILDESVVNFGVVPEGVWQNANFYLSNASALDVPFSIELASPASPSIRLDFQSEHILRAGQSHVAVPVRGLFACSNTAVDPANADLQHRALLAIRSKRNQQVLLLELTCDTVERLSVSADLIPIPKRYTFTELTSFFKHAGESTDVMVQGEEMPVDLFVRALLDNLILEKVFNHSSVDDGQRFKGLPPRHPAGEGEKEHLTRIIDPELSDRHCQCSSLQPYCPTAHLRVELPDHSPILAEHLAIVIRNYTGCVSDYRLEPLFFGPIPCSPPSPRNSEQAGVMGTMTNATITGPLQLTASPSTGGDGRESQLDAGWKTGSIVSLAASAINIGRSSRSMENRVENAIAWGPDGERPAFWTTAINSTEKRERQRRAALAGAQNLLLDGRGCCSALECLLSNDLNPYAQVHLPLSLIANLPGVYEEKIRVTCGELPAMDLPVVLEVQGKPLLLDPTTSGLTMSGNREVLLMPPVIASIGTSRRNLRLMNRVPRDISVRVEIFLSAATFGVTAVEENADASQVTLTLAPLTQQERERSAVGAASVTPAALFMPAMSHKEILIEYTPDAAIVADVVERMNAELQTQAADEDEDDDRVKEAASQEVDWTGSLVIYAELARSSFNDAFLIDEFYHANATRYPSTRKIRRKGGLGEGGAMPSWMTSIIRSIPMLYVSRPLRTRPGHVIRLNKLLKPSEAEKFLVQRELHRREVTTSRANLHSANSRTAGSCSFATRATSACSMATSAQPPTSGSLTQEPSGELHSQWSESTSDEDGEEDVNIPLLNETGGAVRPLDELLDEEEERRDLMKYLTRRREEVRLASLTSFTPIELQLRARCGVPRLAVQPSEFGVEFPRYHPGQWCGRTIRLTNHNSAALLFTLESLQPALFHISKVELVPSEVEEDPLIEDDEESRRCRRELKTLKWGNVVEQQRALEMMRNVDEVSRGGQRATSVAVATIGSAGGAQQLVYQLRCEDSMDVTVQLVDPTNYLAAHANILQKEKRMSMESALRMHFINPDRLLSANDDHRRSRPPTASSQHQSSRTLAPMTLAEQTISLRATFTTPIVTCHPSVVWFRPGHTVTDGRPQPSYTQRLTLSNNEEESVPFELRPVSLSRAQKMIGESVVSITCERQDLTMDRKVAEVINMPLPIPPPPPGEPTLVEDSTRFELSTLCGVLPPATAGGQPGLAEVTVQFTEHSNVRYECAYSVFIKGQPADTYVLLRGDSRETEI